MSYFKTTTIEMYKRAYEIGASYDINEGSPGMYTACLNVAYNMGQERQELDFDNIVECVRSGDVPDGGISYNYRDDRSERGLSVLNVIGEKEIGSAIWFDREEVKVKGIRLPYKGSDGETLILPLDIVQYDF